MIYNHKINSPYVISTSLITGLSQSKICPRKVSVLTFLNRVLKIASALGVAMTGKSGSILERGVRVLTWQWSSRLWVISKQSSSGRSCSCLIEWTKIQIHEQPVIYTNKRNHLHVEVLQNFLSSVEDPRHAEVQVPHQDRVYQDPDSAEIPQPTVNLNEQHPDW